MLRVANAEEIIMILTLVFFSEANHVLSAGSMDARVGAEGNHAEELELMIKSEKLSWT